MLFVKPFGFIQPLYKGSQLFARRGKVVTDVIEKCQNCDYVFYQYLCAFVRSSYIPVCRTDGNFLLPEQTGFRFFGKVIADTFSVLLRK